MSLEEAISVLFIQLLRVATNGRKNDPRKQQYMEALKTAIFTMKEKVEKEALMEGANEL